MNPIIRRTAFWTPRVICILFALFLVLFSFDVFEEGRSVGEMALGLLIHNIPTIALFITLYFAWRREWIGAVVFAGLGALYIVWAWGRFPFMTFALISGPLFLLALLFLLNWIYRAQIRPSAETAGATTIS